jgi:hypothetical protein
LLHPNIRNSLTNLCRHMRTYNANEV